MGLLAAACVPVANAGAATLSESFDSFPPTDWVFQNNSSPLGGTGWFAGSGPIARPTPGPFDAYNGAHTSYAAASFASTTGGNGTISNWMITPSLTGLTQGDTVSFYTRRPTPTQPGATEYPDRVELRVSTNGSCSPGSGAAAVGDFTTLLLEVNPDLETGVYPDSWTRYEATLPPMAPATGCVAFRYHVTQAGPAGIKSDYIGIDQVDVTEEPDDVTPDTEISDGPTGATGQRRPTFTYAGTPSAGVGSYECRLTSGGAAPGAFAACETSGFAPGGDLADGAHVFEVRAVSHGGNIDATPASRAFTVDTTPPNTIIASGPSGPVGILDVQFEYVGMPSNDVARFECRLNDGGSSSFEACPDGVADLTNLSDGTYTFEVRAVDALGNTDPTPASRTFRVDTVAPDTEIIEKPAARTTQTLVSFAYAADPAEVGDRFVCRMIRPSVPVPEFAPCAAEGKLYFDLADGDYRFEVRAIDAAGNAAAAAAVWAFTVDTVVPKADPPGTQPPAEQPPAPPIGRDLTPVDPPGGSTSPTAPKVSGLRLERSRFRAWKSGPSFGSARDMRGAKGRGTWLRFTLDRDVRIELRISRQVNRRWRLLRGTTTRKASRGANRVPVRGRFGNATLRPGTYRLSVTLVDTATGAKATELRTFRIRR